MYVTGLFFTADLSDTCPSAAPDTHVTAFKVAARPDGRLLTFTGGRLGGYPPFALVPGFQADICFWSSHCTTLLSGFPATTAYSSCKL
jgi:hypothetical protein